MLISRGSRQKYQFDDDFFQPDGSVRLGDYSQARRFAAKMSSERTEPVPASDLQAMSLLDEVLHILLRQYELQNPGVLSQGLGYLQSSLGESLESTLIRFTDEFPPQAVYFGDRSASDHLAGETGGHPHRQAAVEELLLINVANQNPALAPYRELISD